MGCDIHAYVETRTNGTWAYAGDNTFPDNEFPKEKQCPFDGARDYGLFGFLADVRNYSESPVIAEPRGLPADVSAEVRAKSDDWNVDGHSHTWLTLAELLAFDYDQTFADQRGEGEPQVKTVRRFLHDWYFGRLDLLAKLGAPDDVRIVFWFDN
ncbi:hypothetical protein DER29_6198 [Micromonospora sp. M71_S20]|uniref:hypothetical protein n=1 Tax=Micromonospora sp. M71_S20 TaxID=592872 RepID=UPI000EAB8386|nr:hypothetical protein [Micromonospora sp. M71_S20]RLK09645.1 hypothetical protein DER29_6198 [Micromonospora sp. M71_S20]